MHIAARTGRLALLVAGVLFVSSCDRLIIRGQTTELSMPISASSDIQTLKTKVNAAMALHGLRAANCREPKAMLYCEEFSLIGGGVIRVSVSEIDRSKLNMDFGSFGNLIDPSDALFDSVVAELQRVP